MHIYAESKVNSFYELAYCSPIVVILLLVLWLFVVAQHVSPDTALCLLQFTGKCGYRRQKCRFQFGCCLQNQKESIGHLKSITPGSAPTTVTTLIKELSEQNCQTIP